MWDSMKNLKTCEIGLEADLSGAERAWLLKEIMLKTGVRYALYHPSSSRRVVVEYDADLLNPLDLVDFLGFCGLYAAPWVQMPAGGAAARLARRGEGSREAIAAYG